MRRRTGAVPAVVAFGLLALVLPLQAHAQDERLQRPSRGLFGGGGGSEQTGQTLDLNWWTTGGYDDNVIADAQGSLDPSANVNGSFGTAGGRLEYNARGERMQFGATAGSGGRYYYPDLTDLSAIDGNAGVNFAARLGRNINIRVAQTFQYQPYYQFGFLTGLVPSNPEIIRTNDEAVSAIRSYDYGGFASGVVKLGARSSATFDYSSRRTSFVGTDQHFSWLLAAARFQRNLTRYAGLRLGYGYGEAQNTLASAGPLIVSHLLDVGFDYSRPLSFSRRTTIAFGSGTTVVNEANVDHLIVNADASLVREIGRTWRAGGSYHRGVQYVPGFSTSLLADTVQLRIGGLLNRRADLSASVGYSSGQAGLTAAEGEYSTYSVSTALRIALNRWLSVDTQYFYYRYGFDDTVDLPFGLVRNLNRHGFRTGLSGWLPLFR